MRLAALILSNSIFAAFFVCLYLPDASEGTACNVHWIRYMYMRSCGRKKRDSILIGNESFPQPKTTDLYAAIEYLKQRNPYSPLYNENAALLHEILDEDGLFQPDMMKYGRPHPKVLHWMLLKKIEEKQREESIFLDKLLHGKAHRNRVGIRGFPEQWNVNELIEQKTNKNYRRQIDRLMEQCCKTTQENTCSEDTFRGAC